MAAPYILARTMKEAHDFARETLGLPYGRYRIVNSPSTIKSVRGADLYLVPGHGARFDRFAMKGAIRWTRMHVIDVEADGLPTQGDPRGPLTDEVREMAYAEHAVRSGQGAPGISSSVQDGLNPPGVQMSFDDLFSNIDAPAAPSPAAEPEAEEVKEKAEEIAAEEKPAKRRRRSRCKDCGELHFKDEACASNDESV